MFSPSSSSPFRRRRRRLLSAATALPLLAAGLAVLQAPAQATPQRPVTPARKAATHTITLVTGDVVTVTSGADGARSVEVDRPDDAVGSVHVQEIKGDVYVVPDEAMGLLAADRLDRRLFNVTDLIEMGYDDATSGGVPLIATFTPTGSRAAEPAVPRGSRLVRRLAGIRGAALKADKAQARTFWKTVAPAGSTAGVGSALPAPAGAAATPSRPALGAGVAKLWLDGRVKVNLKESVPLIGAPEAWAAGYDGKGVTVAVLDTGVDVNHPDLKDQIDATASFVPGEGVTDVNGHGTHVAGTIVGTGEASGGEYKGVAPGADLIVGKVLGGEEGSGQDSWVIAGMQWAAQSGADIVSMSLGDSMPSDGSDPMSQTVDALSAQYGTLFVIAAGNAGEQSISTPGAAASALTVAATDKQDNLAGFSSTGPLTGTGAIKPDIAAPGVDITAARSQEMTDGGEGLYRTISGTSMATPHVSGAAAILAQRHPDWTGAQLKEHLMSSTKGLADWYSPYEVGTGRLDVAAAVRNTVRSSGPLFFGNYTWPHEPSDTAVSKDVVFTNDGAADVTLNLALTSTSGVFALGASTVTVPAGGKAAVAVTGDPQAAQYGRYGGYVVGTDAATGQPVTRTAVAMIKEDERYDLTIKLIGRDGGPAAGIVTLSLAGDFWPYFAYVDGSATYRMPPGVYSAYTHVAVPGEGPDRTGVAALLAPETDLRSHSAEIVLDARKARLMSAEAPQRVDARQRKLDFEMRDRWGAGLRHALLVFDEYDDLYVTPTARTTETKVTVTGRWRLGEPTYQLTALGGLLDFPTVPQFGAAIHTGTDRLRAVYAGKGSAADYAKIKAAGKIAVIERSDEVSPAERAAAATAAGAKALVVVNDAPGGLTEKYGPATIPLVSVHRDAGRALIGLAKLGRVTFTAKQAEYPAYLYDLLTVYPDQVPDRPLVYRPGHHELAKIDARYHHTDVPAEGSGVRYDLAIRPGVAEPEREWHPWTRTEWVTPDVAWGEHHAQYLDWTYGAQSSGTVVFGRGERTGLDWFAPVIRPAFSTAYAVKNGRARDYLTFSTQAWSSSDERLQLGGWLDWGTVPERTRIYQGDTLLAENDDSALQFVEVPAGNLPYRVVLDAARPADAFRLSTRTHTEWTFMSDTVDSDDMQPYSVLQLDYKLATDLHGDVKAGSPQQIALRSVPSYGGTLPGHVTKVTLDVSYDDGAHWSKVSLTRGADGWWRGTFRPSARSGGFVSVRASAETGGGYSIKQEIIRAYGLR